MWYIQHHRIFLSIFYYCLFCYMMKLSLVYPLDKVLNFNCLTRPTNQFVNVSCYLLRCLLRCFLHRCCCDFWQHLWFPSQLWSHKIIDSSCCFLTNFLSCCSCNVQRVSIICFLVINFDKQSLRFEKIPEPPLRYFHLYPCFVIIIYLMRALRFCIHHKRWLFLSKVHHKGRRFRFEHQPFLKQTKISWQLLAESHGSVEPRLKNTGLR